MAEVTPAGEGGPEAHWLNRTVWGVGVTSALGDITHEAATVVLPGFLAALGIPAAALGAIEGMADAGSSFVKLGAGHLSDRLERRKPLVLLGYALTPLGQGLFAFAHGFGLVLVGRLIGWLGRGVRGPLRDAILAEAVTPQTRGRAFGLHRASDTAGAVVGPLVGVGLLAFLQHHVGLTGAEPFRWVFLLTLAPGLLAVLAFAWLVRERPDRQPSPRAFGETVRSFPLAFVDFLVGVGVFGMGDFAPTLLILAATTALAPSVGMAHAAVVAGLLYVWRNVVYGGVSFPVGALADRWGARPILVAGYGLGTAVAVGVGLALWRGWAALAIWAALFTAAGVVIAIQDALEATLTAELIPAHSRGTAFGVLATVNGLGDLASSVLVGFLWTFFAPSWGFAYAAIAMGGGTLALAFARRPDAGAPPSWPRTTPP